MARIVSMKKKTRRRARYLYYAESRYLEGLLSPRWKILSKMAELYFVDWANQILRIS